MMMENNNNNTQAVNLIQQISTLLLASFSPPQDRKNAGTLQMIL